MRRSARGVSWRRRSGSSEGSPVNKALKLADNLALPADEAVTQKYGFIGRSGSGKSYGAMKLAELFLGAGAQVIVLTLADEAEVEQAIAHLSGTTLHGRPLRVDRALERPGPGKPPDRHWPHDDRPRRRESW